MEHTVTGSSELLKNAGRLFKANWKILTLIAVLPSVGSAIGELMAMTHSLIPAVIGGIVSLASAVFSIAMVPALVNAIHRISVEPGAVLTVNKQYQIGFSFFLSVLWIAVLNGLIFFGSFFLLVIPAIIIGIYECLYIFALVLDGKKGFAALTESYSLVRGRWWLVLGRICILGLSMIVVWLILAGLGFILGLAFGIHAPIAHPGMVEATLPFGATVIALIVHILGLGFILPFSIAYTYDLYNSLKATRLADVSTGAFKKWLIAFICIGIIAVVGGIITIPIVALSAAGNDRNANMPTEEPQKPVIQLHNGPGAIGLPQQE